jgi:FKBP-type peptidyl-prolyl cis-trans isomerase
MADDDKPSVKAKLPSAREIHRGDFTPHGIKGKKSTGARNKPSGLTAAEAAKRRRIFIAIGTVVVLAIAGGVVWYETRPAPHLSVSGGYGKAAKVKIPKDLKQPVKTTTEVIQPGNGATVTKGDYTFINALTYVWNHKKYKAKVVGDNTLTTNKPQAIQVGGGQTLAGLEAGLTGKKVGSRVVIEIPPKDGLGTQGNSQYGITASDTLVFVVDIVGTYGKNSTASGTPKAATDSSLPTVKDNGAGKAPTVTIPKTAAPTTLKTETLIQGTGTTVAAKNVLVMQYHGVIWRTGQMFDSTYTKGTPFVTQIGTGQVIKGWDKALVGQKVGSRVLMVIPPADGYGSKGSGAIKGTDTMVFVADILAAYPAG